MKVPFTWKVTGWFMVGWSPEFPVGEVRPLFVHSLPESDAEREHVRTNRRSFAPELLALYAASVHAAQPPDLTRMPHARQTNPWRGAVVMTGVAVVIGIGLIGSIHWLYLDLHPGSPVPKVAPVAAPAIGTLADLSRHVFVSYIGDLLHFPELDFLHQVAPQGSASIESSNLVAQLRATLAGAGLCILPAFLAREEPGLVRVLPGEVILTRTLWLIVHQDLAGLARVKAVVRFLKELVESERALFRLDQ